MKRPLRAPSPAFVVSLIALFVALGGTTYAATSLPRNSVGTKQLKKGAVTAPKIKNGAVTAAKINTAGLTVPNALQATTATNAGHATTAGSASPSGSAGGGLSGTYPNPGLASPEAWHEIGASGEPSFENGWSNLNPSLAVTAAFYKDPFGVVHLKGEITGGAANSTIFTLPAGYRPSKFLGEIAFQQGTLAQLVISNTGSIALGGGLTGPLYLDGVTFRAGE